MSLSISFLPYVVLNKPIAINYFITLSYSVSIYGHVIDLIEEAKSANGSSMTKSIWNIVHYMHSHPLNNEYKA